jgi:hypothetical protein
VPDFRVSWLFYDSVNNPCFSNIEALPMAALTGVMMMVAMGTFEWMSLKIINKMPKADIVVAFSRIDYDMAS